jgi:hypothetical protein
VTAAGLSSIAATTLKDAAVWCHWADDRQFTKVELPTLQQSMLAPLRWFAPAALRPRYVAYLAARAFDDEAWVKAQTRDAYKTFAAQLARSGGPFLFGSRCVPVCVACLRHGACTPNDACGGFQACIPRK